MSDTDPIPRLFLPPTVRQILVVDGDESVVAGVRNLVGPYPCRVDSTANDCEAEAMIGEASERHYDVILADLHLVLRSGSALWPLIKAEGSRLPIVLTCPLGFDPALRMVKARHFGVRQFMQKPFRAEHFFKAIDQVIDASGEPGP